MFDLYKKLMIIIRKSSLMSLENNDEADVKFIKETYNAWVSFKNELKSIVSEVIKTWEASEDAEFKAEYFG
jgi:hypothetical protein